MRKTSPEDTDLVVAIYRTWASLQRMSPTLPILRRKNLCLLGLFLLGSGLVVLYLAGVQYPNVAEEAFLREHASAVYCCMSKTGTSLPVSERAFLTRHRRSRMRSNSAQAIFNESGGQSSAVLRLQSVASLSIKEWESDSRFLNP